MTWFNRSNAFSLAFRYTYEPRFHQLASIRDPLQHTTTIDYDSDDPLARPIAITDATARRMNIEISDIGLLTAISQPVFTSDPNPALNTTRLTYIAGDLTAITDPLGRTTRLFTDAAGRVRGVTSPLGEPTRYDYDPINHLLQVTDPLGGVTTLTYNKNGALTSVMDARQRVSNHKPTAYSYNPMNQVAQRTDQLGRSDIFDQYDPFGNLTRATDRNNTIRQFEYDGFRRRHTATLGSEGTISYSYDLANRLRQIQDTGAVGSPTITRDLDDFDRLMSETTPDGTITYAYDGYRRKTMTVAGQPSICYDYDDANRLIGLRVGSCAAPQAVAITYDAAGRRQSVIWQNGVTRLNRYDAASQLTGIEYEGADASILGNLVYAYNANGHRTGVGGTWARTSLPTALGSAFYDDANRLGRWGEIPVTYDLNGRLWNDGTVSYVWNARNQLTAVSNTGLAATFAYDARGRRRTRTVNGTASTFVWDGWETAQVATGSSKALMLDGLYVDDHLGLYQESTLTPILRDAIGSTSATSDSNGAVNAEYTYEPFGSASVTNGADTTEFQFAGRENDEVGVHYLRARYYHPTFGRFINEDPIGFRGGDSNLYRYARNNPINRTDPNGTLSPLSIWAFTACSAIVAPYFVSDVLTTKQHFDTFDTISRRGQCVNNVCGRGNMSCDAATADELRGELFDHEHQEVIDMEEDAWWGYGRDLVLEGLCGLIALAD